METEAPTETKIPTETDEPMGTESYKAAGKKRDVALVRAEGRATILEEVLQNQAASLGEFRAAHTPTATIAALAEYTVDHCFVEALDVVLQQHQQEEEETTANYVDCKEELNTSDKVRMKK
jgi:hypothetical protein